MRNPFLDESVEIGTLIDDLRRIARAARRRIPSGDTLSTTALVNELYLKLASPTELAMHDRQHFFALAARAMRYILINAAQARCARQHLMSTADIAIDDLSIFAPEASAEYLVAIDQAVNTLAKIQPRLAKVVICRFFTGYTETETADILEVDVRTIQRDWRRARAWLERLVISP